MDKITKILLIVSGIFAVVGVVFLGISIFSEEKSSAVLSAALLFIMLSNLLNIVLYIEKNRKNR